MIRIHHVKHFTVQSSKIVPLCLHLKQHHKLAIIRNSSPSYNVAQTILSLTNKINTQFVLENFNNIS